MDVSDLHRLEQGLGAHPGVQPSYGCHEALAVHHLGFARHKCWGTTQPRDCAPPSGCQQGFGPVATVQIDTVAYQHENAHVEGIGERSHVDDIPVD